MYFRRKDTTISEKWHVPQPVSEVKLQQVNGRMPQIIILCESNACTLDSFRNHLQNFRLKRTDKFHASITYRHITAARKRVSTQHCQ